MPAAKPKDLKGIKLPEVPKLKNPNMKRDQKLVTRKKNSRGQLKGGSK